LTRDPITGYAQVNVAYPRRWPQVLLHGGGFHHTFDPEEKRNRSGMTWRSEWALAGTEILGAVNGLTLQGRPALRNNWPIGCVNETELKTLLGWTGLGAKEEWDVASGTWAPTLAEGYGNLWLACEATDPTTGLAQVTSDLTWDTNVSIIWKLWRFTPGSDDLPGTVAADATPYVALYIGGTATGVRIVLPVHVKAVDGLTPDDDEVTRPRVIDNATNVVLGEFGRGQECRSGNLTPKLLVISVRFVSDEWLVVEMGDTDQPIAVYCPDTTFAEAGLTIKSFGVRCTTDVSPVVYPVTGTGTKAAASAWGPWNSGVDTTDWFAHAYCWTGDGPTFNYIEMEYVDDDTDQRALVTLHGGSSVSSRLGSCMWAPTVFGVHEYRTPTADPVTFDVVDIAESVNLKITHELDGRASTADLSLRDGVGVDTFSWLMNNAWCEIDAGHVLCDDDKTDPVRLISGFLTMADSDREATVENGEAQFARVLRTWASRLAQHPMLPWDGFPWESANLQGSLTMILAEAGYIGPDLLWEIPEEDIPLLTIPGATLGRDGWEHRYVWDASDDVMTAITGLCWSCGLRIRVTPEGLLSIYEPAEWDAEQDFIIEEDTEDSLDILESFHILRPSPEDLVSVIAHVGGNPDGTTLTVVQMDNEALWNEASPYFIGDDTWAVSVDRHNLDPATTVAQEYVRRRRHRIKVRWSWLGHPEYQLGMKGQCNVSGLDIPSGFVAEILSKEQTIDGEDMRFGETVTAGVVRLA
jgi:hypothetical protein